MTENQVILIKRINRLRSQLKEWDDFLLDISKLFQKFPDQSIQSSRRLLEYMVYAICDQQSISRKKSDLFDLIERLHNSKIIPSHLVGDFNYIRLLGNNASHANSEKRFNVKQAENVLTLLCTLLEWFSDSFKELIEDDSVDQSRFKDKTEEELFQMGKSEYDEELYDDAIKTFNFIIKTNIHSFEAKVLKAEALIKMKRLQEALDEVKSIPRDDIEYSGALRIRAHVSIDKDDNENALKQIRHALKVNPDCSKSMNLLGFINNRLKRIDEAERCYSEAFLLNPKFVIAVRNRAIVKKEKGNDQGSLEDYTKVIELEPNKVTNYIDRAILYEKLNDYEGAIADYKHAVSLGKPNARYFAYIADCYVNLAVEKYLSPEESSEAIALEKSIQNKKSEKNLAVKEARYEEAADLRESEQILIATRSKLLKSVGEKLLVKRNELHDIAEEYALRALNLKENDDYVWASLGFIYYKKNDYLKADLYYKKAIELNESSSYYHLKFGIVKYRYKKYEEGIVLLKKALELDVEDKTNCYHTLVSCYINIGKNKEALQILNDIEPQLNDFSTFHCLKALCLTNLGNYNSAIDAYNKAEIELTVFDDYYRIKRHKVLMTLGKYEEALKDINLVILNEYDLKNSYAFRVETFIQIENIDSAISDANKYFELSEKLIDDVFLLIRVLYKGKKYSEVLRLIQELSAEGFYPYKVERYYLNSLLMLDRNAEIINRVPKQLAKYHQKDEINSFYVKAALKLADQVKAVTKGSTSEELTARVKAIDLEIQSLLTKQEYENINALRQEKVILNSALKGKRKYWLRHVIEKSEFVTKTDKIDYDAVFDRALAFYRLKEYDDSIAHFKMCYENKYIPEKAMYNMILCLEYKGDIEKAKEEASKLISDFPNYTDGKSLKERIDKL